MGYERQTTLIPLGELSVGKTWSTDVTVMPTSTADGTSFSPAFSPSSLTDLCWQCGISVPSIGHHTCPACSDLLCQHAPCPCCQAKCKANCDCLHCSLCGALQCNNVNLCTCKPGDTKNGVKSDQATVAREIWQLPLSVSLKQVAATFYLLYDLHLADADDGQFQAFVDEWAPVFARYADMVVGGELRHAPNHFTYGKPQELPTPLGETLRDGKFGDDNHRHVGWLEWHAFRAEHGTVALEWAQEIFRLSQRSGFGGNSWADIAEMVRLYETGAISSTMLIDMCWSTAHNGGQFMNKLWVTGGVQGVLNENLSGNLAALCTWADPEVARLWKENRNASETQ